MPRFATRPALLAAIMTLGLAACSGADEPAAITTQTASEGVEITPGFARTPREGAAATAGYFSITVGSADRLVRAETDAAGITELHTMEMNDEGVMRMRPVEGVALPAGETVAFEPGGLHLMFFEMTPAFADGETIDVTLHFENAPSQTITLPVGTPG